MSLKWTFPSTNGGAEQGFNDSGQELFRSDPLENAMREIIQNSLDAVKERDKPVEIRMFLTDVPSSEIGAGDLAQHMESALKAYKASDSPDEQIFYEKAVTTLRERTISVLGITDKNTTGLIGDKWEALVHKEGTPHKRGMSAAGGSFGIGKNAPYLVSGLKTVCYSTRYLDRGRQEKFIARCKISSHPDPCKPGIMLQHIGFGTKIRTKPGRKVLPTRGKDIHPIFRLDAVGSGIFILGFEPLHNHWVTKTKKTVACNFFAAIHEKKLRIRIEDGESSYEITHETLDDIFETTARRDPARHYYHLVRSANAQDEEVQGRIGRFSMRLAVDNEDYPHRIAYINRRGMLVTDAKQINYNPFHVSVGVGWAKYVAVLRAADDKTDEQIRKMEPPNHKSIEYKRIIDVRVREQTKEKLDEVRKSIESIVDAATKSDADKQEINLHELWDIMPADKNAVGEGSGGDGEFDTRIIRYRPNTPKVLGTNEGGGLGGRETRGGGTGQGGRFKGGGTAESMSDRSVFGRARTIRHGDKLRVAFTPVREDDAICFVVKPAGEDAQLEREIRVSDAQAISHPDMQVNLKDNRLWIEPQGADRIVLDLDVGRDLAYTGYEIHECVHKKKDEPKTTAPASTTNTKTHMRAAEGEK